MALARDKTPAPRIVAVSPDDGSAIDLRNPALAAALAWAVPGLGHLYQGRVFKGRLFMGAILGTFLAGMWLGGGKVVYASWKPGDTRWAFVCQAGAGLVALPAVVQALQLQALLPQAHTHTFPFSRPPENIRSAESPEFLPSSVAVVYRRAEWKCSKSPSPLSMAYIRCSSSY